ncbi:UNVERIFIED_CONTAM: hypothetical protein PYX00_008837 [Menopon gallinae]|uniref:CCHC-type domain-containing protein n=1 Tax=Menopon gallinae TaxID=328185 RepID=A0AAW2H934_9NEOP
MWFGGCTRARKFIKFSMVNTAYIDEQDGADDVEDCCSSGKDRTDNGTIATIGKEFVDATGWKKKAKQLARSLRIISADKECPSHLDESEQKEDLMAKLAKCSIKDVRVTSMVSTVRVMTLARVECPLQENENDSRKDTVRVKSATGAMKIKCLRCSGSGHRAANCERDPHFEVFVITGSEEDTARREETTKTALINLSQGNVNRSRQSQDLMIATESGLGTSVTIGCEPCRNTRRKYANRFTDEDGDVTEIQNANIVDRPFRNAAAGKGYVIASDGRWHIAGCYIFRN